MFKQKRKKNTPYKSAFETTDDPYDLDVPIIAVGEKGALTRQINIDLESKDLQAYWQTNEQWLWLTIAFCSIYFLYILITYGA